MTSAVQHPSGSTTTTTQHYAGRLTLTGRVDDIYGHHPDNFCWASSLVKAHHLGVHGQSVLKAKPTTVVPETY